MSDIDYGKLIVQPGKGYSPNSVVKWSYYNSPIMHSPGELSGNSRRWGDASADVQKQVINILIDTSRQLGLNDHETALVLAIARHESGFNPDAAAGTTSAQGLGQFVNKTGAAYDLTDANRWDTTAQAVALVAHFVDNQILAASRGQSEEYIYKYHHDGATKDYGGLNTSETKVMPYVALFEQVVKSVPIDQQASAISQAASSIVTPEEPSWMAMLYGELRDGASAIAGWIPEKISSMLQDSGISGTVQNQGNQQTWTFTNGLKVVNDFANNLKTWIWNNDQGGTTETRVQGSSGAIVQDKASNGAILSSAKYTPVTSDRVHVSVSGRQNASYTVQYDDLPGQKGYTLRSQIDDSTGLATAQLLDSYGSNVLNQSAGEIIFRNPDTGVFTLTRANGAKEYFDPYTSTRIIQGADGSGYIGGGETGTSIPFASGGLTINPDGSFHVQPSDGSVVVDLFQRSSSFNVSNSAATQGTTQTNTPDTVTPSATTGIADSGGTWTVSDLVAALNDDTTAFGALKSDSLTGGRRTGANSISGTGNTWDLGADAFKTVDQIVQDVINGTAPSWANLDLAAAAAGNSHATEYVPADPLVLDLNGDGVKLTSYAEKTVLFDIDHDGGSKEQTGWVSAEDGIVVMDLNGNGQIDDISETMSEYFNGAVGTNGDAGTKPYANGFEALRSLNSNNTGTSEDAFDNQDTAFANVKVWVDANSDGVTDAGELKTLTELNITSINLTPTAQSGLVNGGNEILATGTFTQNGSTKEAQAANFIANPYGQTLSAQGTGTRIDSQTDSGTKSAYVSHVTTGEVMDAAALNVANITGNAGNDTLTGDASANWLAGGQGSDTFNAGAGDDVLLIDAEDLQANIHGGDGNDIAQVIGDAGVTLNLAQAEIEAAIGGRGNDILIGGGRSSVFIRAGDGDDIVIGGAANDALSGENGNDLIDGGAGNDIIRGGRGQDQLMGGIGDDLVFGGQDDDRLSGGAGNDVLRGEQGDDNLDGGDGIDIAEFSGSFSDYRITKLTDTSYRVVDTKAGRDGADMLTNIEKLNFADVSAVDITLDNPLPVKDVLTIADRVGMKLIKVADLLANDRDWQGDALHITTISDVKGGTLVGTWNATTQEWTPTLTANGELQFTPDPAYTGVMSFKYKLADADGTPGATAFIAGTQIAAEMRGQVFLKTPDMPTDGLFTDQWYLNDINVLPVWQDAYGQGYTGKGVRIAQFEPGMPFSTGPEVFDYRHADLQANVDPSWIADPNGAIPQSFSQHATLVAGVMTAARNGEGAVGVAYDAELSGHYIQGTGLEIPALEAEITAALAQYKNYDVVNNSWGSTADFDINVVPVGTVQQGILDAVMQGRGGLGTAIVGAKLRVEHVTVNLNVRDSNWGESRRWQHGERNGINCAGNDAAFEMRRTA